MSTSKDLAANLAEHSTEKLQELISSLPPSSVYHQAARRALTLKRMAADLPPIGGGDIV